jgi:hypothetical protein
MTDVVRGLVLLVSVLLCLPVLPPLLAGEMSATDAAVRYAGALLLAWGGASVLSALAAAYGRNEETPPAETTAEEEPAQRGRRQDDLAPEL